jgi:hypothetical protein
MLQPVFDELQQISVAYGLQLLLLTFFLVAHGLQLISIILSSLTAKKDRNKSWYRTGRKKSMLKKKMMLYTLRALVPNSRPAQQEQMC